MHATTVKNKITQRDNYKEIMSVIVVVLLLTLTLIAIFSAIDQLGISEMGRIARDLTHFIINSLYDDPAAWTEQEQLLKQMTVENVNTAVKQYLSHPVNTYTGVLLPK